MRPFLVRAGLIEEAEMDRLYQQAMIEMMSEDFCGIWYYMTAWGSKP